MKTLSRVVVAILLICLSFSLFACSDLGFEFSVPVSDVVTEKATDRATETPTHTATEPVTEETIIEYGKELYIPDLAVVISEFAYDNQAGSCFFYDLDNDKVDELVLLSAFSEHDGGDIPVRACSVYDIEDGEAVVKWDKEVLFFDAGAPSGYVSAANYNGETVILMVIDNGGTGNGAKRQTTYTVYDPTDFQVKATAAIEYITGSEYKVERCTINDKSCTHEEYSEFVDSIEIVLTAEANGNNDEDGSMDIYELLYMIQTEAKINATESPRISKSEAEETANSKWGEYLQRDQGFDWKIFEEKSLIKNGAECYCYTLRSNSRSDVDWRVSEYLFINSVTGATSERLYNGDYKGLDGISSENDEWKYVYIDYLNSLDKTIYGNAALLMLDNDDIPEMLICGNFSAANAMLCWIDNGEIQIQYCAQTFGYIPNTGKCYSFMMKMGVSQLTEYYLENGELTDVKIASGSDANNTYIWNEQAVSVDEYWDTQSNYIKDFTYPEYISIEDIDISIENY